MNLNAEISSRNKRWLILLIANEPGVSSLHIWTRNGINRRIKVNVLPAETARVTREIGAFLKAIPNSKITTIGDKVVVEGDNLSDADLAKIDELAKRYPQIVNFANRIGWEKMVVMEVKVVEFPVTELREIGLKWGATGGFATGGIWSPYRRGNDGPYQVNLITGAGNPAPIVNPLGGAVALTSSLNILSALNMGLNAQLNLLAQNGRATILAEPVLSARSGAEAKFLAGGEFPYSVSTINGVTIIFREYGVKLNIKPQVDANGVIRAKIMSEVSNIDASISTVAGPALQSRKTETEFNVREGETIVLSGLLTRDISTNVDKLPFLGDLPVLGALFRSKRYQNKETELVVFVTPRIADSAQPPLAGRIERAEEKLRQAPHPVPPEAGKPAPAPARPVGSSAWEGESFP